MIRLTFSGSGRISAERHPPLEVLLDLSLTDTGWGGTMQPSGPAGGLEGFPAWVEEAYRRGKQIVVRPTGPRREAVAKVVDLRGHGEAQRAVLVGTGGAPF